MSFQLSIVLLIFSAVLIFSIVFRESTKGRKKEDRLFFHPFKNLFTGMNSYFPLDFQNCDNSTIFREHSINLLCLVDADSFLNASMPKETQQPCTTTGSQAP